MAITEDLLRKIEYGGTLDELAKEMGVRKSVLVARIKFLARGWSPLRNTFGERA